MDTDLREIDPSDSTSGPRRTFRQRFGSRGLTLAVLLLLTVWGLTDVRSRAKVDPQNPSAHRTDLLVYTEAGAAMFDSRDPYAITNIRGWHYIYPPLLAILLAPLSHLAPQWQGLIWFAISLATLWGCVAESRRIMAWLSSTGGVGPEVGPAPAYIAWFVGFSVLFPVLDCLQRGQVDVLLVYFLLLGLRCAFTSTRFRGACAAGIVLAFPVAIKVIPALPVGFLCLLLLGLAAFRPALDVTLSRAVGVASGVVLGLALFFVILPAAVIGPAANATHLKTFWTHIVLNEGGVSDGDLAIHTRRNQSLDNAVYRFGNWAAYVFDDGPKDLLIDDPAGQQTSMPMDAPVVRKALLGVKALLLVLLFGIGVYCVRRGDTLFVTAVFSLSWLMILVIAPVFRGHYYAFWWLPVWVVPLFLVRRGQVRLALTFGVSACLLTWVHYAFLETSGRLGLLGLGATVWYLAAAIMLFRNPLRRNGLEGGEDEPKFDTPVRAS